MTENPHNLFNPFPGLRPFEASENHLFFGRDEQSHELLRKLRQSRFLTVVGTSGSGKSSLVRAGLLPSLHGGFMTRAGSRWRTALLRPGHDPIGNLARALNAPDVFGETKVEVFDQATIIEVTLRRSDLGLVEAARQARLPAQENLLIIVDQFEELFRFKQSSEGGVAGDDASEFVTLLLQASRSETVPIYVVLTMRSDFLGDCSQFHDLPEAMNEGQYLVPRMTRLQRNAAISGPVAVGGGEISPRLVQQLLNDVGDNPDQLPILQHSMMRTWDHWTAHRENGSPIDLDHYESIGGMQQALSFHADEAYEELPDERSKKIAEKLFKTLSERGADNREIRRPTKLAQICGIADASEDEVIAVVNTFRKPGRSFLMPPSDVALTPDTLIDVSHESLIRNWQLLKQWVDEETRSAQTYLRLAETGALFKDGKAGHWRDPDLQIALNWREQNKPNETWGQLYHPEYQGAMAFLEESKAHRDAEIAEKEAAQQRELQQAKALVAEQGKAAKRLKFALGLSSVLLLAAVFAVVAFMQRQIAVEEATKAELARQSAEIEKLRADSTAAAYAELFTEADSLQKLEKKTRVEVEQQRELAIVARDSAAIERERAEAQAELAETLKDRAITARDTALNSQRRVLAVALTIKSQRQRQLGADTLSALLALEAYRFDQLSGGQFGNEVYDALRRSLNSLSANQGGPTVLQAPNDLITATDFSRKSNSLAVGGADGSINLLRVDQTAAPRFVGSHEGVVTTMSFSADGSHLASGGADQAIKIWNLLDSATEPTILRGHEKRIWSVAFRPDGNFVVSGSIDGLVWLWDLQNSDASTIIGRHRGNVLALSFDSLGRQLASSSAKDGVLRWRFEDAGHPVIADTLQMPSPARALAFDRQGNLLAVAGEDGAVRLVSPQGGIERVLRGHQKRINTVVFSADGKQLAAGSSDKTVRLWQMQELGADPIVLSENQASVRTLAFTATGDTLVTATFGKDILLWRTRTPELAQKVRQHVTRNLTAEEWREYVGAESEYPYDK